IILIRVFKERWRFPPAESDNYTGPSSLVNFYFLAAAPTCRGQPNPLTDQWVGLPRKASYSRRIIFIVNDYFKSYA
ncbi:MAG: hypothetical protein Q8N96_15670, partial [Methylovulum sp.]|nr:hypothetical protein [Methylovulum sp.]